MDNMKLYVYKGEWGLPSIDFECLQVLCTIKFSDAPVEIYLNGNPFFSGEGKLPFIKDGNKKIVGARKIIKLLETKGYSLNSRLNKDIQFLSDAYNSVIFNNLHSYYYYMMFGDRENSEKTRMLYAKRTPFPFNFYYPGKLNKFANDIIEVFGNFSLYEKKEFHDVEQIILDSKKCVNMLAAKLGNKKWFFGNVPSDFDVNVYSYLSILYHISLPNNPLQSHINECENLLKFINRITKDYFSAEGYSSEDKNSKNTKKDKSNNTSLTTILTQSEKEFLESKRKTQILAFLAAFLAMSTYAMWIGLLNISYGENYDDEYFYDVRDEEPNEEN